LFISKRDICALANSAHISLELVPGPPAEDLSRRHALILGRVREKPAEERFRGALVR
jgi:hypothetical protein